jgi:CRP-like cAMP-binding protein
VANPWTMKMEQFTSFTEEERRKLDELVLARQRPFQPGEDILSEGDHSPDCHVVLSGLASRYKILPNGERQIMAFLVPGDLCDAEIFILREMDHSVSAISLTNVALISGDEMKELLGNQSRIAQALWWGTLTDLAVLRERVVDHGRRDAYERIAHLLYELLVRYRMVGATNHETLEFPVTQTDLADATGLTPVHVNRVLGRLREEQLIHLHAKMLTVLDPERLATVAGFNPNYLHLDRAHDENEGIADRVGDLIDRRLS